MRLRLILILMLSKIERAAARLIYLPIPQMVLGNVKHSCSQVHGIVIYPLAIPFSTSLDIRHPPANTVKSINLRHG